MVAIIQADGGEEESDAKTERHIRTALYYMNEMNTLLSLDHTEYNERYDVKRAYVLGRHGPGKAILSVNSGFPSTALSDKPEKNGGVEKRE